MTPKTLGFLALWDSWDYSRGFTSRGLGRCVEEFEVGLPAALHWTVGQAPEGGVPVAESVAPVRLSRVLPQSQWYVVDARHPYTHTLFVPGKTVDDHSPPPSTDYGCPGFLRCPLTRPTLVLRAPVPPGRAEGRGVDGTRVESRRHPSGAGTVTTTSVRGDT